MSIEIKTKIYDTEYYKATSHITMYIKEWKMLRDQLPNDYPAYELKRKIESILDKFNSTFRPDDNNIEGGK